MASLPDQRLSAIPSACPRCGGVVRDRRSWKLEKGYATLPDFDCQAPDKSHIRQSKSGPKPEIGCGWAGWLEGPVAPAPASPAAITSPGRPGRTWGEVARIYIRCVKLARVAWGAKPEDRSPELSAAAATLFIEANKLGLTVAAAAPAPAPAPPPTPPPPPPPPPPPAESFDDFPRALEDESDDGLPF